MNTKLRARLLGTACTSVLALAALPALAQEVSVTDANALITANQSNTPATGMSIISTNGTLNTSFVGVLNDSVTGSTVNTLNNTVASSVLGNEAVLGIRSNVNTEVAGGDGATVNANQTLGYDARTSQTANLAIGVVQGNQNVTSAATTANTVVSVSDGAVGTSTIDVTGNAQRASGALSLAQTSINTTANSSNMTAGIATSQVNEGSSLTLTSASLAGINVGDVNTEGATDSTLTLSGNSQAAFGAGNSATNGLTATVSNATLDARGGAATSSLFASGGTSTTDAIGNSDVVATFAIGNTQAQDGATLNAVTDGVGRGFELTVAGPVATSTLTNDNNTASSSIRGNEATNIATLVMTNVETQNAAVLAPGTVAAIANSQNIDGTVSATTMGSAGLAMETAIGAALDDSTVSTSGNAVTAAATANTGSNRMVVTANGLNTGLTGTPDATVTLPGAAGSQTANADAGFAVSSAQQAEGSVTASLVNNATTPTFGARIQTSVTGNITESTIASDLNTLSATATGNEITAAGNAIAISGTNVTTTTALANSQGLLADVSAVIGTPAVAAVAPQTFNFTGLTAAPGSTPVTTPAGISQAEGDAIALSIASLNPSLTATFNAATNTLTINNSGGAGVVIPSDTYTYGGSPASLASGGVTIAAGADITDSTLSVDGNITRGTVTGNTAANQLSVTAANIAQGSALATANANVATTGVSTATADNALTNAQAVGANDLTTTVSAAFAITQVPTTAVDSSTLSVSGNTQMATTTGNAGVNAIALSATNMDTTSALMSLQQGTGTAALAVSGMQVFAPAATLDSTVDLSRNVNQAMATLNTVNNSVSVSAANIVSASAGVNAVLDATTLAAGNTLSATADNVLNNRQIADTTGSVAATANTTVVNGDGGIGSPAPFPSAGIRNSTINMDANRTVAQSTVNNAVNSMALNGGAVLQATGGVLNAQVSDATSTATASSEVTLKIGATGADEAVDSSTVSIDGNRTAAQASGNVASNALNVSALSLTGTGVGGGSSVLNGGVSGVGLVDGTKSTYGVLNNQGNSGAVTAVVTAVDYGGSFGSVTPALSATASSMTLNGNQVAANAMGNSASNSLTLAALNYGTSSAAIANEQANSANITATITTASLVLNPVLGVGSSNLSSIGNTISSSAVGNSAVSTLIRN